MRDTSRTIAMFPFIPSSCRRRTSEAGMQRPAPLVGAGKNRPAPLRVRGRWRSSSARRPSKAAPRAQTRTSRAMTTIPWLTTRCASAASRAKWSRANRGRCGLLGRGEGRVMARLARSCPAKPCGASYFLLKTPVSQSVRPDGSHQSETVAGTLPSHLLAAVRVASAAARA
jgi:hypothetical protein